MGSRGRVGIVVLNWRSGDCVLDCLESIRKEGFLRSVFLVDNCSQDGSLSEIRREFPGLTVIENAENLGFDGGNTVGIKYARETGAEYILLLNPDTLIRPGAIRKMIAVMDGNHTIGIVGPKILDNSGKIWSCGGEIEKHRYSVFLRELGADDRGDYQGISDADFISGTAMTIRADLFDTLGFFYEPYFIYFEDVEFCLRVRRLGYRSVVALDARIVHTESSSMKKDSWDHSYYMARNHLLFVERNAPFFVKIREIIRLPKTWMEHKRREEGGACEGIRDYVLRRFGKRRTFS